MTLEKKGDPAGARAEFDRFLEIWKDADPELEEVKNARMRIGRG
jgi:hypothetical protein